MTEVMAQALKEWQEFRRDKLSLTLAFLLPVVSLLLFGYGIRLESKNIPIFIRDDDNTSLSREYVERLYATNIFVPISISNASFTSGINSPAEAIDRGLAKAALIIPADLTKNVFNGNPARIEVLIDGTDIANTQVIFNSIQAANLHFLKILESESALNKESPFITKLRLWFNPGRKEALFIVPGAFGIILWMYPALLTAVAMSREKEQETIVRIFAANPHPLMFLCGKSLMYFLVALALSVLLMFLGSLLFDVSPVADPIPLLVSTPLYILASVAFGLLLGVWANSQTTAVQATSTLGFFPCLLLSGFVYPISNIPFPLSLFSFVVPARYYIELARDAFVRGTGWAVVWHVPLVLLLFIAVLIIGSWYRLYHMQLRD